MKSKRAIAIIAVVILLVSIMSVSLVGCEVALDKQEAFDAFKAAIDQSLTMKTYFVKENKYSTIKTNDTTEYRMNIHEDNPDTELNDMKAIYSMSYTEAVSMDVGKFEQLTYGPSLSKDIKPSKAQDSDYKYFLIKNVDKVVTRKAITAEEYFELPEVKQYTIANVLMEIDTLTFEDMLEYKSVKMGVTTTLNFIVKKEGHAYNDKQVRVAFLYGKIALIEVREKGAPDTKVSSKIDITYMGPKITVPNWDAKDTTEV